jgi:hypothetical protein
VGGQCRAQQVPNCYHLKQYMTGGAMGWDWSFNSLLTAFIGVL